MSNPFIDELAELARQNGALGSKLISGSHCISMVKKEDTEQFMQSMQQYYMKKRQWTKQLK